MQRITVERQFGELAKHCWSFWFDERRAHLVLDNYDFLTKETSRHKFRVSKFYRRCDGRKNTLTVDEVPLPDDVKLEAKTALTDRIVVVKWPDDRS